MRWWHHALIALGLLLIVIVGCLVRLLVQTHIRTPDIAVASPPASAPHTVVADAPKPSIPRDEHNGELERLRKQVEELTAQNRKLTKTAKVEVVSPSTQSSTSSPSKTFCLLPIEGEIGLDVLPASVSSALDDARAAHADFVVLVFDTPGGSTQTLEQMLKVIRKHTDLRLVAYVRRAISAGAIMAMACPEIVMARDGVIGGAVIFNKDPAGGVHEVSEKMKSIWRASCRSAAELGGHSTALAQGMADIDAKLVFVEEGGKKLVTYAENAPSARVIKQPGAIVTLSSDEALEFGLANAVSDPKQLSSALHADGWREVYHDGWNKLKERSAIERTTAATEFVSQMQNELSLQLADIKERVRKVGLIKAGIMGEYKREIASINTGYQRNLKADRSQADQTKRDELSDARAQYQPGIDEADAALRTLLSRQKEIQDQIDALGNVSLESR